MTSHSDSSNGVVRSCIRRYDAANHLQQSGKMRQSKHSVASPNFHFIS